MIDIGAEIFIEKGQTDSEIDGWFKSMHDHGLTLTRIRMFENYMRLPDGSWDFSLFDKAFNAADRHGIKIYANLFPETEFSDVGGFKFPKSEENFASIANYIQHVVQHFIGFESLYGWVPINEPGAGELPDDLFTNQRFSEWQLNEQKPSYNSNGFVTFDLAEQRFLLDYNCWFLEWLTVEIRKYDPVSLIHVNNHDIFRNVAEYDFPAWRKFLTSLGGSAHASWHFEYFNRDQFAVAMSANAEILRSGAGGLPWFMTELQGGNNTYSGRFPLCPTKEEIAQWLWINIGAGSKGGMFWCLNPRRSGFEAGEWAMLDYLDQPTDRLLMASAVSKTISKHHELLDNAEVFKSGIHVLYSRESLWIEKALQIKGAEFEGRSIGGVMKSALSYFEVLSEMGIHASFMEMGEYDFDQQDFKGEAIILSHQISIPSKYWALIENFVFKGGKLIVDGLTAYYDERGYLIQGANFPMKASFGAVIKEYKTVDQLFDVKFDEPDFLLKAHLWKGILHLDTARAICNSKDGILGTKNDFGEGSVVWVPAMIGMGARLSNYRGLSDFLYFYLGELIGNQPIRFGIHSPRILMKVMKCGQNYISIIVNKSTADVQLVLETKHVVLSEVLFSSIDSSLKDKPLFINAEETLVLKWDAD